MAVLVLRPSRAAPVNRRMRPTESVRGPSGAEHDTSRPAPPGPSGAHHPSSPIRRQRRSAERSRPRQAKSAHHRCRHTLDRSQHRDRLAEPDMPAADTLGADTQQADNPAADRRDPGGGGCAYTALNGRNTIPNHKAARTLTFALHRQPVTRCSVGRRGSIGIHACVWAAQRASTMAWSGPCRTSIGLPSRGASARSRNRVIWLC